MRDIGYKNEQESSGLQEKQPRESALLQEKNTEESRWLIVEQHKKLKHQSGVADESAPAFSILPDSTIDSCSEVHAGEDPHHVATSHIIEDLHTSTAEETFSAKNELQIITSQILGVMKGTEKRGGSDVASKEEHHVVGLRDREIVSDSIIELSHNHESKIARNEDNADNIFPLRETNNRSDTEKNERLQESETKTEFEDEIKEVTSLKSRFGPGKQYPEPYLAGKPPPDIMHLRQQKKRDGETYMYAVRFRVSPLGLSFDNRVRCTD